MKGSDSGSCSDQHHRPASPISFGSPIDAPPGHLLEITIISAQGLYSAARPMRTYASAWVDPRHKLYTRVDRAGHADPTWNDKFVFRVDDGFLQSDTAAIAVHLHAARARLSPFHDHLLGTVRVVVSSIRPAPGTPRFVALQVRRPASLRPHGILNLGVHILNSHVKSMPIYYDLDSMEAFAYKDLNGAKRAKSNSPSPSPSMEREGWQLERKESEEMESGEEEREREELESKLEMWKAEVTPEHEMGERSNSGSNRKGKKRRRSSGRLSCFSCSSSSVHE